MYAINVVYLEYKKCRTSFSKSNESFSWLFSLEFHLKKDNFLRLKPLNQFQKFTDLWRRLRSIYGPKYKKQRLAVVYLREKLWYLKKWKIIIHWDISSFIKRCQIDSDLELQQPLSQNKTLQRGVIPTKLRFAIINCKPKIKASLFSHKRVISTRFSKFDLHTWGCSSLLMLNL